MSMFHFTSFLSLDIPPCGYATPLFYIPSTSLKGRVPKPLEVEINVLAYAPHFLGFAAAAAAERSEEISSGKRSGGWMPTGLCENSVWPDPEARKKQSEAERHKADPAKVSEFMKHICIFFLFTDIYTQYVLFFCQFLSFLGEIEKKM